MRWDEMGDKGTVDFKRVTALEVREWKIICKYM